MNSQIEDKKLREDNDADNKTQEDSSDVNKNTELEKLNSFSHNASSASTSSQADNDDDEPITEKYIIQMLNECCKVCDFTNDINLEEIERKRGKLLELVEIFSHPGFEQTPELWDALTKMFAENVFRVLSPPTVGPSGEFDPEEDEPQTDPSWPHLQLVYEIFLRAIGSTDFKAPVAKPFMERDMFAVKILDLFDSEDPRERDILKSTIHRIYAKFLPLRTTLRKHINNIFYTFIYETERHNGIGELLEILGSIINGFALPLKSEHKCFLFRVLMPLHKPKCLSLYQIPLSYCVVQFVEKDPSLSEQIILNLLRYWPKNNSSKEIMFLNEIEEVLDVMESKHFESVMIPLCQQLAKSVSSPHFQVSERALFFFNNEYVMNLITEYASTLIPIVFPALYKTSKTHWNKTIGGLIYNAMKVFMTANQCLVNECTENFNKELQRQEEQQKNKEKMWKKVERLAKENPYYHIYAGLQDDSKSSNDGNMTSSEIALCKELIHEHFGSKSVLVADLLLSEPLTLLELKKILIKQLTIGEIREILLIFDHHQILTYSIGKINTYFMVAENIIRLARVPRLLKDIQNFFGKYGVGIVQFLITRGQTSMSDCIRNVTQKLDGDISDISKVFRKLAEQSVIKRKATVLNNDLGYPTYVQNEDLSECPIIVCDGKEKSIVVEGINCIKKIKKVFDDGDSDILWTVNWFRCDYLVRDSQITQLLILFAPTHPDTVGIISALMRIGNTRNNLDAACSQPISAFDVIKSASISNAKSKECMDLLRCLSEESNGVLRRMGEGNGGLYIIDYEKAIEELLVKNVQAFIRERIDDRAARIFCLLIKKGYLEEDQIERHAMIPSKEAKEVCSLLLNESLIELRHISKTGDFAPSKTIYLYSVNLKHVANYLYMYCLQALRNLIHRRHAQAEKHRNLTVRVLKRDYIVETIKNDANLSDEDKELQVQEANDTFLIGDDAAVYEKLKNDEIGLFAREIEAEGVAFSAIQLLKFKNTTKP
ncbi:Serine/threonine-protein phosphatase 2A 56 kDa regulatory subunit epsilon [Strongyloides ratti]|uniref:Serine/threonine-protein phosphatase 2A 56 kDa regulatory subunit epsilon n=1 Tax=Strongyloides ratti TaxID=34506 RepID=A0A090LG55_STRRB|nr:Serine/threonine-protein phosphatase 2A 56 kDa regulatory subunit epsilon [Strongyloides ratti]CEF68766.1 Serine/threonine-protein phosphatase 2A 56 kDa regulatory subunit epsilon [Strongyloides ratti]